MNPLDYACPRCDAAPGNKCRTLTTSRSTDTHQARWDEVDLAIARGIATREGKGTA